MSILVLNAGSSTLKFAIFDDSANTEMASGLIERQSRKKKSVVTLRFPDSTIRRSEQKSNDPMAQIHSFLQELNADGINEPICAVGHRVVHGGTTFRQTTQLDDQICGSLLEISNLAPLHNPPALAVIEAARKTLGVPHFAVFDTAFYADLPLKRVLYPLPYEWYEQFGIRRFGFHGISHKYCATRAAELLHRQGDPALRLIICHLGNGCSATAVVGGKPIATTMGFTPLEGLMMGTRCGSIDPGILFHLLQHDDQTISQLSEALNHRSGLLGVSGISSDFRELQSAANKGSQRATLAIEMFADRIRSTIGSLAATLGGLDALIFTAGIGEHSAELRRLILDGLEFLGLQYHDRANISTKRDRDIAADAATIRIFVLHTCEEVMIARETLAILSRQI